MIITGDMANAAPFDSKDLWETPPHIFNKLNHLVGFTLDPCCTIETKKCWKFYTPETDGLAHSWEGEKVFCNPPYSRGNIDKWVEKCWAERKHADVWALLPVSTSADWFQKYCIGQSLYLINKRVRFVGAPYTAPFSSVIVNFSDENYVTTFKQ